MASILKLTDEEEAEIHRGNRTKLSYRLAWARNYLKRFGLLENSTRGVWALTADGSATKSVDPTEVNRVVKAQDVARETEMPDEQGASPLVREPDWEEEALETIKGIFAGAFETLCQRLLRESGFIQVEVLGRSGDGGIDGRGVVKVGGILSFHVKFNVSVTKTRFLHRQFETFGAQWLVELTKA